MRIPMLGFGQAGVAIEFKDRVLFVQIAVVRHLMGPLTRAEGLRFAVVSFSIPTSLRFRFFCLCLRFHDTHTALQCILEFQLVNTQYKVCILKYLSWLFFGEKLKHVLVSSSPQALPKIHKKKKGEKELTMPKSSNVLFVDQI